MCQRDLKMRLAQMASPGWGFDRMVQIGTEDGRLTGVSGVDACPWRQGTLDVWYMCSGRMFTTLQSVQW